MTNIWWEFFSGTWTFEKLSGVCVCFFGSPAHSSVSWSWKCVHSVDEPLYPLFSFYLIKINLNTATLQLDPTIHRKTYAIVFPKRSNVRNRVLPVKLNWLNYIPFSVFCWNKNGSYFLPVSNINSSTLYPSTS